MKRIFETKRLVLRAWEDYDAESLYEYAKDPNVGPASRLAWYIKAWKTACRSFIMFYRAHDIRSLPENKWEGNW